MPPKRQITVGSINTDEDAAVGASIINNQPITAAGRAQKEREDAYNNAPRTDPNEEIVRGFYIQFTELKNKWSNKSNRSQDLVDEISDAAYHYEEWKREANPDKDSNFGNPRYESRYQTWNRKFTK